MFRHKMVYKLTNLKVHSKGRYFAFQELQRMARFRGGLGQKFSPGTVATPAHITTPTLTHPRTHAFTTYICVQIFE